MSATIDVPPPTLLVIFGAGGDLTWRKLVPALYNLYLDGWMPERFAVLGLDRREWEAPSFQAHLQEGVAANSRRGTPDEATWGEFVAHVDYQVQDFAEDATYDAIRAAFDQQRADWGDEASCTFYLATPPFLVEMIVKKLSEHKLNRPKDATRIVVEKPFGTDLKSAQALNRMLLRHFDETQIYRIDHYLGKENVQNLLALRFANILFEPLWHRHYIDHVQISVTETVGVGHRGGYYDGSGALRDMLQNHLLQLLCLVAMEPMVSFEADEIRDKKVDVLQAVRAIPPDGVAAAAVRGQYGAGEIAGQPVMGYREEPEIPPDSITPTFVALKLYVDNWRWQGVPFYLRTGKRLKARDSEIVITFRDVPHRAFPRHTDPSWQPNRLVIHVQPTEGVDICFQAKRPGPRMILAPADLNFRYAVDFPESPLPEAYETLLLDAMSGDQTLFMRVDQVELAWAIVQPVLDAWAAAPPAEPFPNYAAGSWGPIAADRLLAQDGNSWDAPTDGHEHRDQHAAAVEENAHD
ncbi:MAG: glucose-6-phosphate dehydrogenase [Anaerolineales bacterium]|nr:glucose-6-phosphate dehydrogenase [Anaerolineales bacterium]MCB9126455.1 glucose-6-phosphate dehydrogenase [Ardenticatenales bacterium]MCB9171615.1 glucose-6-phosphate dehydrogenase [Ardenticatenales bacterium]